MTDVRVASDRSDGDSRTVRRRRQLPGTRAVVGALLVVAAAMGTFAAWLGATAPPTTGYLTATRQIDLGEVLATADLEVTYADLDAAQAGAILRAAQLDDVVGTVAAVPIAKGAFVLGSMVLPVDDLGGELFSFSLPAERALGGSLRAPMSVDLLATYGSGPQAQTVYLVRGIQITSATDSSGSLGGGTTLLTGRFPDPATVQRVAHALGNAQVWVVRSTSGTTIPPTYTFDGR